MWQRMNRRQRIAFEQRVNESPAPFFVDVVAWKRYFNECLENRQLIRAELALTWCRLMHDEMEKGKVLQEAINATFLDVAAYFEFSSSPCDDAWHSVLQALEACWLHGHDLHAWHRRKFCK